MAQAIDSFIDEVPTRDNFVAAPSDDDLNLVVKQLRTICRDSSLEFALRVGAVVIHNFYFGDVGAWRTRGPKLHSFRRLAEHPELPMSPAALYRCVAVFELCERCNAPARWRRLGASHLRTVLGLAPDVQEKLLAAANEHSWTVKTLQSEAIGWRTGASRRGGRKPMSILLKSLSAIRRSLQGCEIDLESELDSFDADELERSAALLAEANDWVNSVARVLERRCALSPASAGTLAGR